MSIATIFKTSSGEFEVNRFVGAVGTLVYIFGTHIFIGHEVLIQGKPFDVTAYCLGFPTGLAACVAAIAGAVAIKDKGVAQASNISNSGEVKQ